GKPDTTVVVVNDPLKVNVTNPAPLPVSGTVAVTASSPLNVNIANPAPLPVSGAVTVTASAPLPVTGTLSTTAPVPAADDFVQLEFLDRRIPATGSLQVFTVPAGKVLAIDVASGFATIDPAKPVLNPALITVGNVFIQLPFSRFNDRDVGSIT